LVTDKNFRAEILDVAYSESKPILGLLPDEIDEPQEFYEGAVKSIKVNAFERNQKARNTCIEHYGAKCEVCGMTFESRYGEVGKGFIHVHHLKPLGEIGAEYEVDPINDLRPVCPNCHAMLHMRKPPYSIDEVKVMIKAQESYSQQVA
jgi:5-methylcytosine-specific restriction protein A